MRFYLDTNILVFMLKGESDCLTGETAAIVTDYSNLLLASTLCLAEIVHLIQIGKVRLSQKTDTNRTATSAIAQLQDMGVAFIPTAVRHIEELARLPLFDDHRDPNDRLIISQAISDRIPLVSSDRKFSKYERYGLEFVSNER